LKNLVFLNLWIISKVEKAALSLSFNPGVNLLLGENDVGKSTVIKSLYHCLGADTPQINNTVWRRASPIYCVRVAIGGSEYYVVRDEKYFGVFDGDKNFLSRYAGIGGSSGFGQFMNKLLGFDIELERQADGKLGSAGPAFYFLPFYIDQDEGWSTSWSSFVGLRQFSSYRRLMLDYHLGVRSQTFYDAKKRAIELHEELAGLQADRESMQSARNSVQKRKIGVQVDIDPESFKAEMEKLVDEVNEVYGRQQIILSRIKEVRNQRNVVDTELNVLRRAIGELDADYRYSASASTPDVVGCPTCGTEFCNSFAERFGILDDIDKCHALVDQWLKKRADYSAQLDAIEGEYRLVSSNLVNVESSLARTKENVTLAELIASEGMKEMIAALNHDIEEMLKREDVVNGKISENSEGLELDAVRKKEILTWYKARMKEYLNALNVSVLGEEDYDALDKQIKNNALGSDLPRALLAQYFALLNTMSQFNTFTHCPLLIDSPFQQEQDATNRRAILDFIVSRKLLDQQMILATISVDEFSALPTLATATRCVLDSKLSVLRKDRYEEVLGAIGQMHEVSLASTG